MFHRFLTLALVALFIAPSPAAAALATQDGYGDSDDVAVQAETDSGQNEPEQSGSLPAADASPTAATGSNLPFTGFEAGLIAAAGIGLAGTGVALRRAARQQD